MGDSGSEPEDLGAEEAFRQAHHLGRDPQPGLALVRLALSSSMLSSSRSSARCFTATSSAFLVRWDLVAHQDPDRVELLPVAVEVEQRADLDEARGDVDAARQLRPLAQAVEPVPARCTVVDDEESGPSALSPRASQLELHLDRQLDDGFKLRLKLSMKLLVSFVSPERHRQGVRLPCGLVLPTIDVADHDEHRAIARGV